MSSMPRTSNTTRTRPLQVRFRNEAGERDGGADRESSMTGLQLQFTETSNDGA